MSELILTRGIPGSGKTTWAKRFILENPNAIRVNSDDIRGELFGAQYVTRTPDKKSESKVAEVRERRIREGLKAGKTVINDDTNINIRSINNARRIAASTGATITAKDFPISLTEAQKRNAARDRVVPNHVVTSFFNRIGPNGELPHWDGSYDHAIKPFHYPMERRYAVAFDMDGTLSDTRPIQHYVRRKHKDFDSFHRLAEFTDPNPAVLEAAFQAHDAGFAVIITTARNEYHRSTTQKWLDNQTWEDRTGVPYENIMMRADDDYRPDFVVKTEMFNTQIYPYYDVVRCFDDNPQAVNAWKDLGLSVTIVPGFDEEDVVTGWEGYRDLPPRMINNPFNSPGTCIRCGRKISNPTADGLWLGPNCSQLR